mgnify:CR=1 FL=1
MNQTLGFTHFLQHADTVAWIVLAVLVSMSLISWYWIGVKGWQWSRRRAADRRFRAEFEAAATSAGLAALTSTTVDGPCARLLRTAQDVLPGTAPTPAGADPAERLGRALKRSIVRESARLEVGQTALATIASASPFVGLFGTVWGIYHALLAIGDAGAAGLQEVAGPVGEALIMTGIGLAVAIPASIAYNAFARARRNLRLELEDLAHELYARQIDGGVVGADPAAAAGGAPDQTPGGLRLQRHDAGLRPSATAA